MGSRVALIVITHVTDAATVSCDCGRTSDLGWGPLNDDLCRSARSRVDLLQAWRRWAVGVINKRSGLGQPAWWKNRESRVKNEHFSWIRHLFFLRMWCVEENEIDHAIWADGVLGRSV